MTDALLTVRHLHTAFALDEGTVHAVDDVSFDVHRQQVVGIVGESGCGKSAAVKSILRLIEPPGRINAGQILYQPDDGPAIDLARLDPHSKTLRKIRGGTIALIPQEPMAAFSPVHTIGNQLIEAIRLHQRIDKTTARSLAVARVAEVGIPNPEKALTRYPWELSGGLRQRAMIAMALSCHPKILIADEPTTAIDVTTQAQILALLQELKAKHKMAIVFITHDLGVIAQLADHVVVMYLGQVVESGPVDTIFHDPLHPYTQALLRSIPTLEGAPQRELPTIKGAVPHPFNRPRGCPFVNRCTAQRPTVCEQERPPRTVVDKAREVCCFLYPESAKRIRR